MPAEASATATLEDPRSLRPTEQRAERWRWRGPALTRRHLVVALGVLWIVDGVLQLQPYMYSRDFVASVLQYQTMGKPNPATDLIRVLVTFTYSTPARQALYNTLAALIQLAVGAALVSGRMQRVALSASFAWGLVPWLTGEGLGGMLMPQSSMFLMGAPGSAVLYSLLSLVLWPKRTRQSPDRGAVADQGLLGYRGACVAWATIWIGTGLLELEHSNWAPNAVSAQFHASGEPGWLAALDRAAAHVTSGRGTAVALGLMVVQVLVGWWVLRPPTRRLALGAGMAVSVIYWVVGQNFGLIFTGQGTDPNLGPPMILFALALWPWARAHQRSPVQGVVGGSTSAFRRHPKVRVTASLVAVVGLLVAAGRGISLGRAAEQAATAGQLSTGRPAPAGDFTALSGGTETVADMARPTVLWFITTWCQSCRTETTALASEGSRLRRRHYHVVELELAGDGVGLPANSALSALVHFAEPYVRRVSARSDWTWGVASSALSRTYDPRGYLDEFYLIAPNGNIVGRGQDPVAALGS